MRLENKVVVVTGASSGMGKVIVEEFAKEGANVVAVARRMERLEELAESLKDAPGKVAIYAGDISSREVNDGMIDFAVEQFGHLDVLINNAGIMDDMSPIGDVTDEMYEKVMKVNVYGPMAAMRKATQVFLEQGNGGNIINVASIGAFKTAAGAIYGASKSALVQMSKNTAYMYMPQNIRCNVIAPGPFITEISNSMGMPNMNGFERVKTVMCASPEPANPIEIAYAAIYLASDESKFVNGAVLNVDGGWMAS